MLNMHNKNFNPFKLIIFMKKPSIQMLNKIIFIISLHPLKKLKLGNVLDKSKNYYFNLLVSLLLFT